MIALLRYNGGTLFTTNLYWNYANGKSFKTYHCSLILPVVFRLSTEQACWLWSSLKRLNACLCDLSPGSLHFGWILFHFLCSAIWWNFYCRLQMNVKAAPLISQRHPFNGSDLVFAPCSIKIDTCASLSIESDRLWLELPVGQSPISCIFIPSTRFDFSIKISPFQNKKEKNSICQKILF